jgi:membrane protease subunit (stomatin/prohibitin family)
MLNLQVVSWKGTPDIYAWKWPSAEIPYGSQLIVYETQEAVLMRGGQMLGPFAPGQYTLNTQIVPGVVNFMESVYGGNAPFTADVWFVNRTDALDVPWGTPDPIQLMDPKYGIMLPVRAHGQFGLRVEDTRRFLIRLVGTLQSFTREQLVAYFRGIMVGNVKELIAGALVQRGLSFLEISASLTEISAALEKRVKEKFADFGLSVHNFNILSINAPEDDPAVQKLKEALARKAEMQIVGYNYQQERTFDTLEKAAGNTGPASSTLLGAGLGLGMGLGIGPAIGNVMGAMSQSALKQGSTAVCPNCRATVENSAAFCGQCGKQVRMVCAKCKAEIPGAAKFCAQCGAPSGT